MVYQCHASFVEKHPFKVLERKTKSCSRHKFREEKMKNKIQRCLFLLLSGILLFTLPYCKKDPINTNDPTTNDSIPDNPTPDEPIVSDTTNYDLVDFAFRDLVGVFNLDTVGKTKTLQMSYPFNEGDYMVYNFDPQTKQDTMTASGVYHYTGSDESIPSETPFSVMWTKKPLDGQEAVRLKYEYNGNKNVTRLPNPFVMYLVPGQKGDNNMQMIVTNTMAGSCWGEAEITGNNAHCTVSTDHEYSFDSPFNVNITENYPKP